MGCQDILHHLVPADGITIHSRLSFSADQKSAIRLLHACSQSGNISVEFGSLQTCSKRVAIRVSRVSRLSRLSQPSDTNLTSRREMCDKLTPSL